MPETAPDLQQRTSWDQRALDVFPGGTTRGLTAMHPLLPRASAGSGYTLRGENGETWIDLNNNFTSLIHGHAHGPTVEAASEALHSGASFGISSRAEIELAELLVQRTDWADQVRFCNSGTEAVMTALRLARSATGRRLLVIQTPAYHGAADTALSAVGGAALNGVPQGVRDDVVVIPPGNLDALTSVMRARGNEIAGVVIDLMPSRAGSRPLSREFVEGARTLTTDVGSLMLVDEVVTLRLATPGMARGQYGVEPDLLAVGKIVGGGLPVGALLGRRDIMSLLDPRSQHPVFHGGTFSGNPVTMRAGHATLSHFGDGDVDRLNELGYLFRDRLARGVKARGFSVTGWGSLAKLVDGTSGLAPGWQDAVWWSSSRRGVLLIPGTLLMCLSTPMDEDVVTTAADAVSDAVRAVAAGES